jgi:SPX domain protein involved in polyphosphate accumulation
MNFRREEKLRIASSKIFLLKEWISNNNGTILFPSRFINSIYFDNENYSMYNESIEGLSPRKKIRIRTYGKEFEFNKDKVFNKEIKITSVEGRFKISEKVKNPLNLINFGIYDFSYGICLPVINVVYQRSYYKVKNVRLTIDEKIIYKKIINNKISKLSTFDNYKIVELKYSKEQSINDVLENFPFERTRFSKYCRGVEFIRLNYSNEL